MFYFLYLTYQSTIINYFIINYISYINLSLLEI
nr:MAG TPA: hypothetical protein [Bacteriophage sp.]